MSYPSYYVSSVMQHAQDVSALVEAGPSGSQVTQRCPEADDLAAAQLKLELLRIRHLRQMCELQAQHKAEMEAAETDQVAAFSKQIEKIGHVRAYKRHSRFHEEAHLYLRDGASLFHMVRDAKFLWDSYQNSGAKPPDSSVFVPSSPVTAAFQILIDIFFLKANADEIYIFVRDCREVLFFPQHFSLKESKQLIAVKVTKFIKESSRRQDLVRFSITHVPDIITKMYNSVF